MQKLNKEHIRRLIDHCDIGELNAIANHLSIFNPDDRSNEEKLKSAIMNRRLGSLRRALITLAESSEVHSFKNTIQAHYPERFT